MRELELKSIKFWTLGNLGSFNRTLTEHTWQLGPGPCGENVYALYAGYDDCGQLTITQCTDKSTKVFVYNPELIRSRVEMTIKP